VGAGRAGAARRCGVLTVDIFLYGVRNTVVAHEWVSQDDDLHSDPKPPPQVRHVRHTAGDNSGAVWVQGFLGAAWATSSREPRQVLSPVRDRTGR
jgi:hypothetical protein